MSEAAEARRAALLDAMADHLLAHGLAGSPLRALGRAAGTSDRMLLYYFPDKDALLRALLAKVAARLLELLGAAGDAPRAPGALLAELWAAARGPGHAFMLLFLELAARAGRGEEPYRAAAAALAGGFRDWAAARLDAPDDAAAVLAALDGAFLLLAAGRADLADAAVAAFKRG